jgi:hypothetical protein
VEERRDPLSLQQQRTLSEESLRAGNITEEKFSALNVISGSPSYAETESGDFPMMM